MKFVPRHTQIIGRMVIRPQSSLIAMGDETKVTKFILVDAVGEDAAKLGVKPGDLIVPKALSQIVLESGRRFCPILEEKDVAFFVRDYDPNELHVQIDSAVRYVPFDSPEAAKSIGAQEETQQAAE